MNWLHLTPTVERRIALHPRGGVTGDRTPSGSIAAVNGEKITY
jgi:hypothetical protein